MMKYDMKVKQMVAEIREVASDWVELSQPFQSWEASSRRVALCEFLCRCEELRHAQVSHLSVMAGAFRGLSYADPSGELENAAQHLSGFKKTFEDTWDALIKEVRSVLKTKFNTY